MLTLLLAILLPAPVSSARSVRDIVRAVEAHYQRTRTLAAVFLERYSDGQGGVRVESGKVYFSRPDRMRWEYESPQPKLFLLDGKNVWFYVPADRTASRTPLKKSADWRTPLALLMGRLRFSRICRSVGLPGERGDDSEARPEAPGDIVLRCLPKEEKAGGPFSEVLFEVNSTDQLTRVLIRQPSKIELEFHFADWAENIPLPSKKFHFEPPIGVAIVNEANLVKDMQ